MVPLNDSGWDYKLNLLPSSDKSVYFHYHLNCQHFPDNKGDNKQSLFQSLQWIVFAFQLVPLNDNRRDNKIGLIPSSDKYVYFQYHLNCQYSPDNKGDNKQSLFQSIKWIVFAFETAPLDDNGREFKDGLLRLSHKSVYFQYPLICQHFPDKTGDNKRSLFQSIQLIVFAFQLVPLNDNRRDNKIGLIPSSDKNVYFQYHLNCQYSPDNKGDNKCSLFQSIQ